jgi:uncharacterized protein (TIGR02186 family)
MMHLLRLGLLLIAAAAPVKAQETVVTGLATDTIALTADFDGSEVFVFGAVRREGPVPADAGPLDIIITLRGPERPLWVRRKERRFGIWMNTDAVRVRRTPSYYAVASTRPVGEILNELERLRWSIGMDQAVRPIAGHPTIADTTPFTDAIARIMRSEGLYALSDDGVRLMEETLFQATFALPANIVEGSYSAEFFLVRHGAVVDSGLTVITVAKAGLERWIYNLSREQPLAYGGLAVALALATGWLAAGAFRLIRR